MVKISPSTAGGAGLMPGELRSHMPCSEKRKKSNKKLKKKKEAQKELQAVSAVSTSLV